MGVMGSSFVGTVGSPSVGEENHTGVNGSQEGRQTRPQLSTSIRPGVGGSSVHFSLSLVSE